MKIFVAEKCNQGKISENNFHWTDDNDIVFFCIYNNHLFNSDAMCGINSLKFTTHVKVSDININREFYKELIQQALEIVIGHKFDSENNIRFNAMDYEYIINIDDFIDNLLQCASKFKNGDKIKSIDGNLFSLTKMVKNSKLHKNLIVR
jgi:hypothetical protein